nr:probable serine/threonine-protein kinase PkwA [Aegilops tauschii subsp. strangulata]
MTHELLRYRPVDDFYEDWLDCIAEPVSAAGCSPAPSLSLPHPPPAAGDVAHGAPPPPPRQDVALAPRRAAPRCDPPCKAPACEEESCQEVQRPQEDAPALPAPPRRDRAPPTIVARECQGQAPPPRWAPVTMAGCCAFTPELCSIV